MQKTYSGVMTHNGVSELLCYTIKECFLCCVKGIYLESGKAERQSSK